LVTLAVVVIGLSLFGMACRGRASTMDCIAHCGNCDCSAGISFVCSGTHCAGTRLQRAGQSDDPGNDGRLLAHPQSIYFFGAVFILRIIIWMGRPLLLIFVILIPLQVVCSGKEERVLTEEFGAAYLDYKRKTWF
jgi:hypothetical protein